MATDTHRAIEAVWRIEAPRLIAGLTRLVRDVGVAEELVDAGVLLAAEGLRSSADGARIYFDGDSRTVVDGPFTETKELVAGFYLVEMKSREECVEWFKRCPIQRPGVGTPTNIEIRRVIQPEDLGEAFTPELREAVEKRDAQSVWDDGGRAH